MSRKAWFVPKRRGYGATPVTWEGWALVLAFVVGELALAWVMVVRPAVKGSVSPARIVAFLVLMVLLMAILIVVGKARTDGEWRWR